MLGRLKNKKAQSVAEYVIVLALVVGAVVAMQTYVKRGLQGRIRDAVDYVDNAGQTGNVVNFTGGQYEPYYLGTNIASYTSKEETDALATGGSFNKTLDLEDSTRTGSQTYNLGTASND